MRAGLGELTNLKTQSGDRMSRAEEGKDRDFTLK